MEQIVARSPGSLLIYGRPLGKVSLSGTSPSAFAQDGLVTFSALGKKKEFLSADTLNLLKCKEQGDERTAGLLAGVCVITQTKSRWLAEQLNARDYFCT